VGLPLTIGEDHRQYEGLTCLVVLERWAIYKKQHANFIMRVYIHDEEQEFTAALTWDEADKNNIEKLKQTFLPKQSHFKSITEFDLVSERGKEVTVIKNKMDIFVKKTNKVAPQSPQPQQTTSKQPTEGTTKKQALRPDVIEYVNKLSKEASVFYEKKKFNVRARKQRNLTLLQRAIQIYEELIGIGVDRPGCLINLGTMYHACGSHEKAVKCFAELVEMQRIDYQILVK
jgi:tetratricopeptide (TPR) repeat protein